MNQARNLQKGVERQPAAAVGGDPARPERRELRLELGGVRGNRDASEFALVVQVAGHGFGAEAQLEPRVRRAAQRPRARHAQRRPQRERLRLEFPPQKLAVRAHAAHSGRQCRLQRVPVLRRRSGIPAAEQCRSLQRRAREGAVERLRVDRNLGALGHETRRRASEAAGREAHRRQHERRSAGGGDHHGRSVVVVRLLAKRRQCEERAGGRGLFYRLGSLALAASHHGTHHHLLVRSKVVIRN